MLTIRSVNCPKRREWGSRKIGPLTSKFTKLNKFRKFSRKSYRDPDDESLARKQESEHREAYNIRNKNGNCR